MDPAPPPCVRRARLATCLVFFAAGFALAGWAPLVPFARARAHLGDGALGLVLLGLGAGSIAAMPVAGAVTARIGSRLPILAGAAGMALALPLLAVLASGPALAAALLLMGAALGTTDVAMNIHAVAVERAAGRALMSGFHGMFSVGALAGAAAATALLSAGLPPVAAALAGTGVVIAAVTLAWPRLLAGAPAERAPLFAIPRARVLVLGLLAGASFLVEGAMADWGGVLLVQARGVAAAHAGIGFALFSAAMTAGRLGGDRVVARIGARRVLLLGPPLAAAGLAWLLAAPGTPSALAGFAVAGVGASNIAPILFSAAGRQRAMPGPLAVAAVSMVGYAGVLAGPAAIGGLASVAGLPAAIAMLAALMLLLPLGRGAVPD